MSEERKYGSYTTEGVNEKSANIDKMTSREIVTLINSEDKTVAFAVEKELDNIALAVDLIVERMKNGGRLIYIGAGTSGRLGLLDAAECPPTYGVSEDTVKGIIAGGKERMLSAGEAAEDDENAAVRDLDENGFDKKDVLMGISASGSADYVLSALRYAKSIGAGTVALSCRSGSPAGEIADVSISPVVGPEVIQGSTRMKAGTAQKMVLTMISTAVMVRMGRVIGNRMAYMRPSNKKLFDRAVRIISAEANVSEERAKEVLEKCRTIPDSLEYIKSQNKINK